MRMAICRISRNSCRAGCQGSRSSQRSGARFRLGTGIAAGIHLTFPRVRRHPPRTKYEADASAYPEHHKTDNPHHHQTSRKAPPLEGCRQVRVAGLSQARVFTFFIPSLLSWPVDKADHSIRMRGYRYGNQRKMTQKS